MVELLCIGRGFGPEFHVQPPSPGTAGEGALGVRGQPPGRVRGVRPVGPATAVQPSPPRTGQTGACTSSAEAHHVHVRALREHGPVRSAGGVPITQGTSRAGFSAGPRTRRVRVLEPPVETCPGPRDRRNLHSAMPMSNSRRELELLGRRAECEKLDELLASVRGNRGAVLVIRGEAGVGKTALLDYLVASGSGCRIIRTSGVESEMELPFSSLHLLIGPLLQHLDGIPAPQREALETAFGMAGGDTPDRFMVGLAVLSLLSAAAEKMPLVCVVDDAQWLDRVSAQTLEFVARRLLAEPIALVVAVREPGHEEYMAGLQQLQVSGLAE